MILSLLLISALSGGEGDLAALVVLAPKAAPATVPRAQILEAMDVVLRERTSLALRSAEQLGLDEALLAECPAETRLGCIVEHVASRGSASAVAIVSFVALEERRHRVQLSIVDVASARAELARGGDRQAVEDAIYVAALHADAEVFDATERSAMGAHTRRALAGAIRLQDPPRWLERLATLGLAGLRGPTELRIDQLPPIVVEPKSARVGELRAGKRAIQLSSVDGTQSAEITLEPGKTSTLAVSLTPHPVDEGPRALLMYGGIGAAGVGVVAAVISGVAASSVTRRCIVASADADASCSGLGWPGFGVDGDAFPSLSAERVNSGPPLFVIGAGLVGLGAALGVLEGPLRDTTRPLWIDVAIAGGAAVLGVAVSAAIAP